MKRSRLNRSSEKKQKRTIFLSIFGILMLVLILFKFGLPALISFSLFISGNKNSDALTKNELSYIPPPSLNSLPNATNNAKALVSGTSQKDVTVELFLNGKKISQVPTDSKEEFSFEVTLGEGDNVFRARAIYKGKRSDFSRDLTIAYKNSPPKLEITSPADGATFKKEDRYISVKGTTDPSVAITVNGFFAVINDINGFSYSLALHDGENEIKILAQDQAGNTTEKTLKVNYSP